ncbi:unnamed protein product [Debaryomyces fabryi]|nr:unnamed protein product [Debaryomyces fabryi]
MASNIQVVVRCRGRNSREVTAKSPPVVDLPSDTYSISNPTITVNQDQQFSTFINSMNSKTYTVDQVYGSQADQLLLFDKVAMPLFNDFINGFNVTILAYGQTGTGKTYTMCGNCNTEDAVDKLETYIPLLNETAGIIPRTLNELFKSLESDSGANDYVVKCSFIELYNEDLKDLLNDDTDRSSRLRIFESKKPNSDTLIIQNLQETYINNAIDGLNILRKGLIKRKTASTKLNDVSSRSHTIFTVNLYKKQGNEFFKVSKMNLVDLAGSENINRSGAVNQRAKEAGLINQSLLTLGRVINSLSDRSLSSSNTSHIPYRESKLTRLLQDSIGGQTKTALIATISPAKINLDETISTLEYASRAKNIQNKPQLGQDCDLMLKKILLKDMSKEIAKLNNDLIATRNKNGIWMDENNYNTLIENNDIIKAELKESNSIISGLNMKLSQLSNLKKTTELNNKNYKNKINEYQLKVKNLENIEVSNKKQISDQESMISMLNDKVLKLNENYQSSKLQLNQLITNSLKSSISLIESVVNDLNNSKESQNKSLNSSIESIQNNLQACKNHLSETISSTNTKLSESIDKIPKMMNDINANFHEFHDIVSDNEAKIKSSMSDLKIANDKFSGYITEEHLDPHALNNFIDQIVSERVNKQLSSIKSDMMTKFATMLDDSHLKHEILFKDSINEVSSKFMNSERSTLLERQSNWFHESKKFYNSIEKDATSFRKQYHDFNDENSHKLSTTTNNISSLITNTINPNLAKINQIIDKNNLLEDMPKLKAISDLIIQKDDKLCDSLNDINQNMNTLQHQITSNEANIIVKSPVRSPYKSPVKHSKQSPLKQFNSPTKEPTSSPSKRLPSAKSSPSKKSPLKRQSSSIALSVNTDLQRTKIPQLSRSNSDKENLSAVAFKRRRIIHDVNTTLNK